MPLANKFIKAMKGRCVGNLSGQLRFDFETTVSFFPESPHERLMYTNINKTPIGCAGFVPTHGCFKTKHLAVHHVISRNFTGWIIDPQVVQNQTRSEHFDTSEKNAKQVIQVTTRS